MSLLLARGHVYHARQEGVQHRFRYPVFYVLFRSDQEENLRNFLRSRYKRMLSVCGRDYLRHGDESLDKSIKSFLKEECAYQADEVWLHTMPRMFGYAFNPVSFWLCRRDGQLEAVLCEVNNTFGEKHFYWICPPGGISGDQWFESQKMFHVSPFFPVEGFYKFRFQYSESRFRVDINYFGPDRKLRLATWTGGELVPLERQPLSRLLLSYGWMTPLVVLRIHTQALRLWINKIRFYKKPDLPSKGVTK